MMLLHRHLHSHFQDGAMTQEGFSMLPRRPGELTQAGLGVAGFVFMPCNCGQVGMQATP